ncbi:4a-hydroxytetrahydrobiopterin dehydratase [Prosthecochloris sp. N3]|uniref:Putative pterin-4-alpha-carbinolamine dehydratase n=1 Tax=Prosthecochloris ethylica TaxID=2743976 RepID=A0ABR9XUG5_9CHLB|nr:4a-hydroxytetrahydrobiopterin dehydratase [Prosthecochloris ethylica]MBF0587354.1 4a-hydroxytetrahydrobiopterin dehydratase [Prosthecochloris ethylica]MBF0637656.1 4a-hydroxytetrahydrobiopterin dehydratase [Prosthecochloris ethylica]MEC9486027.1 4a-hydroxytetrahydrobiopterin dehydratase [Prosthecochloris sp.]NUK48668.1 4a-hydroxytetrahydrobiopterin dehydratase [Prosthecochloris ethylica]
MLKLHDKEIERRLADVPGWELVTVDGEKRLSRVFAFDDFVSAMAFAVRVGMIAEKADHHPRLVVEWGRVQVEWWSHSLGGLGENDFVMAARTGEVRGC